MDEDRVVQFDDAGAVRIYDPERYKEARTTLETGRDYLAKMDMFKTLVGATMSLVEQLGRSIEREKLKAIGMRNVAEREVESRKRAKLEVQVRIHEKQAELDRLIAEHNSLVKVEQEQRAIVHRLNLSGPE